MPGGEHADGWAIFFLFLTLIVILLLAIAVLLVGFGGAVSWAMRRSPPSNRLVQVCMVIGASLVALTIVPWIADGAKLPAHLVGVTKYHR